MHVYGDLDIRVDGLADCRHPRDHRVVFPRSYRPVPEVPVQGTRDVVHVEFHRVEASGDGLLRHRDGLPLQVLGEETLVHGAGVAVGVETDLLAERAAQEAVDGNVLELAGEVPERYLDAAYRRDHRPRLSAREDVPAAHLLVESLHVARVLADDLLLQVYDDLVYPRRRRRSVTLP